MFVMTFISGFAHLEDSHPDDVFEKVCVQVKMLIYWSDLCRCRCGDLQV